MRNNQPVTQQEQTVPADATLMSVTDTQSHVRYANAAFIAASGYSRDELLGQPHNLVRHPDMPVEAFADMWRTLKGGESWTALVKNRCKNGDHYWVRANAAPVVRQGAVTGYISVRTRPGADEVRAAEGLYQRFRTGHARGLSFCKGVVVGSAWGLMGSPLKTWSLATRVRWGSWSMWPAGVAVASFSGLEGQALMGFGGGLGAVVMASAWWLQTQIVVPLRLVASQARAVATGQFDANVRLDRVDDIGMVLRGINQAGLNVRSLVDDVGVQVDGVRTASGEIADASADLGSRTEHTAANLEQTAAAMEQMTSSLSHNAETAVQAKALATQAALAAAVGGRLVSAVEDTMQDISQASRKIADITGSIDGIAFQTNILALNAAVEAARAGEQGRGFAVVAGEVRTLAQRSAAAAREIKTLIGDSVGRVDAGAAQVAQSRQAMGDIVAQVQRVADLISEISAATKEQATGVGEVNTSVGQLDQMTQQNAAMVEQMSAAAASLRDQSARLVEAVAVFQPERA